MTPDSKEGDRFERLQDIIGGIAYNTTSVVFWEGMILDENAVPLD